MSVGGELRARLAEPKLDEVKGFGGEGDLFRLSSQGEAFKEFFGAVPSPTTVWLDGEWGTGKSTFLKQLTRYLKSDGFPAIYFDAFASDYVDQPFDLIASALLCALDEMGQKPEEPVLRKIANAIGQKVFPAGVSAALAVATQGAFGAEALNNAGTQFQEATQHSWDAIVKRAKRIHEGRDLFLEALKNAVSRNTEFSLDTKDESTESQPKEATRRPIVIIVDELDRCRPEFALAVLEVVKHYFDIEGIHFVLCGNLSAMTETISVSRFQSTARGADYLKKFFDFRVEIKSLLAIDSGRILSYVRAKSGWLNKDSHFVHEDLSYIEKFLVHCYQSLDFSLRDINQMLVLTALKRRIANNKLSLINLKIFLNCMAIRQKNPDLYNQIMKFDVRFEEIENFIRGSGKINYDDMEETIDLWKCLLTEHDSDPLRSPFPRIPGRGTRRHPEAVRFLQELCGSPLF